MYSITTVSIVVGVRNWGPPSSALLTSLKDGRRLACRAEIFLSPDDYVKMGHVSPTTPQFRESFSISTLGLLIINVYAMCAVHIPSSVTGIRKKMQKAKNKVIWMVHLRSSGRFDPFDRAHNATSYSTLIETISYRFRIIVIVICRKLPILTYVCSPAFGASNSVSSGSLAHR